MRFDKRILPIPNTVAAGAAVRVADMREKTVQVGGGAFTGTVEIQGRADATLEWVVVGTLTAPGAVNVAHTFEEMRANVTALSAGTPVGFVVGRDSRSDG